jgi:hypothetical protein
VIDEEAEVVDGLPVPAEPSVVEGQEAPGGAVVPARQAAALAATGFVAGVTTVAVVRGARAHRAARKRKKKGSAIGEIMSSNSFLIDVHLLRRD